jgi:hypothetical protein
MGFRALYSVLYRLLPKQRIPKLPGRMYSSEFHTFTSDERRVLARLGARDPKGIRLALKRHNVETVDELVRLLDHQRPQREFRRRWAALMGRTFDTTEHQPHAREIIETARRERRRQRPENRAMEMRLRDVLERFDNK